MIKQKRNISLIKGFKMEISRTLTIPYHVDEKDIVAMFYGLINMVKSQAKLEAKEYFKFQESSYDYLMRLYQNAVKNMNKYKSLYLKAINS